MSILAMIALAMCAVIAVTYLARRAVLKRLCDMETEESADGAAGPTGTTKPMHSRQRN